MLWFVLVLVSIALLAIYWHSIKTFEYWKIRGVKHDEPVFILGTNLKGFLLQKSMTQMAEEMYWKYPNEKVVGYFRSWRPELIIRDPDVIKRILVTDFACFYPRGLNRSKKVIEPLMKNLFFADGDLWKLLRQRMTPAFSSGKLKAMFPLVVERAERLQARVLDAAAKENTIDARDLMARYTTDFIGACGFGLDANSLDDENSAFRKLGAKIFYVSFKDAMVIILKEVFPETFRHLKYSAKVENDVMALIKQILVQRNYKPSGRNDFIDLMLECRDKGVIEGDSIQRQRPDGTPEKATLEMDEALIAAQTLVFFAAGFETSSSATSFTLHQLAYNPEVQEKVHKEIDKVLAKYNNKLSYEAIKEMTYLEWSFKEAMRMFPSLGFLIRECARRCPIPEVGLTLEPGVSIFIPLQALHMDPQYFPKPEEFYPERFDPMNSHLFNKQVYLPFGYGPRACIGERLGLMQSLAGLAAVLAHCSVRPAPSSQRYPEVNPRSNIVQSLSHGVPLIFERRKTSNLLNGSH